MMTGNKYKILLFVDLILSWSLLDPTDAVAFNFVFDSPEYFSLCSFLTDNPMEAETIISPLLKPYFVYSFVISKGRLLAMEILTLAAGTRGPPLP